MRVVVINRTNSIHVTVESDGVLLGRGDKPSQPLSFEEFDSIAEAVAAYRRAVGGGLMKGNIEKSYRDNVMPA